MNDWGKILLPYYDDPAAFAEDFLGFVPDPWQRDVMSSVAANPKVTVRSGQGVGKTGVEASVLLWYLSCRPYARVVATAPTQHQLYNVLWAEIAKWLNRSHLQNILLWKKTRVEFAGEEARWFAVAKTAKKPENIQGFHEEHMLFIVDEASGIEEPVMEAILGTLSGGDNKLLTCGNPTRTAGTFHSSYTRDRALYVCHKVSSLDSPRTNKDNIRSLIQKYGKDSNVVRVRVLGEPPKQEDDVFIPLETIERSIKYTETDLRIIPESIRVACDVARFGSDKTIIAHRIDELIQFFSKVHGRDTMRTADAIIQCCEGLLKQYPGYKHSIPVCIDDSGVGGGVTDRLRQLKRNDPPRFWWMDVIPVNFGRRIKHRNYHDSTTYMFGVLRDLLSLKTDKPLLVLPDDEDLVAQLSCRKYALTEQSKIKIESKDDMKKRGLPSPDEADCVLLLCLPVRTKKPTN
jgi:hypothetical protein